MLEAARWAPTHKLTEPWHFVILEGGAKAEFEALTIDRCGALLPPDKAEATVAKLTRKRGKDWPKVRAFIAICMKRNESVPEWEELAAVAAAVQNMQLAAAALGVGCYWSSWQPAARDSPEMHALLRIDGARGDRCLGVLSVGHPDGERVAALRARRAPLEEKVLWL
ncbi:ydjA [Scenedesmus sp. PABB004]|nr:ydjA [Scenedesmus sp. PABB004]